MPALPPMLQLPAGFEPGGGSGHALDDPDSILCLFAGDQLVQRRDGPPARVLADYRPLLSAIGSVELIGHHAGRPCLAASLPDGLDPASLPGAWQAQGLRAWLGRLPDDDMAIAMLGGQLLGWQRTHRFCGACGSPTQRCPRERAIECPRCGLRTYPRISPAMMVLINRGRQLLLASNHTFPDGRYSALAGFLEAGESVEAAIHREVLEEVGVRVHRLRYVGSQSWPFPHSLMLAFTAEWLAGDIRIDADELRDARWFDLDQLPDLPPPGISISRALIEHTAARLRQTFPR